MSNKKLNVELLLKVKQHILDEPKRLRMDTWLRHDVANGVRVSNSPGYGEPRTIEFPACGTVGCIAGWTAMLANPEYQESGLSNFGLSAFSIAKEELNIDEEIEPFHLFYPDYWPTKLYERYLETQTAQERASIVAEAIDFYIQEYQKREAEAIEDED
jgi:hypothetical protein